MIMRKRSIENAKEKEKEKYKKGNKNKISYKTINIHKLPLLNILAN